MEKTALLTNAAVTPKTQFTRVLGTYTKDIPGPTIVCFCGMHGNEPAGVIAFDNVLKQLNASNTFIKGQLIGLTGNIKALEAEERYLVHDLNRLWTVENIDRMFEDRDDRTFSEACEQRALFTEIQKLLQVKDNEYYFLDLHTTSSISLPYISINDTLRNRNMAMKFPLPIVLGLEEYLEGTILNYINQLGHIALGVEGGQHDDPQSIHNHEAVIWTMLDNCGCTSHLYLPDIDNYFNFLHQNNYHRNKVFELRHRHIIKENDRFQMLPGLKNFQPVKKNQWLANDINGEIKAGEKGRIFMPLYQSKGNDGFFLIREVRWLWLNFSAVLRRTKFHRLLHLFPGVTMENGKKYTLVVNTHIARWFVREFFHLMGFRMKRRAGKYTIFTKREFDVNRPVL